MKSTLFFILFLLGTAGFGQTYVNEQRLVEYLGQDRYTKLYQAGSGYLKFLDARLSYGFELIDYVPEKMSSFVQLQTIEKVNADKSVTQVSASDFVQQALNGSINYLLFKFEWDQHAYTYYRLGDTGKALLIFPTDYVTEKMNN